MTAKAATRFFHSFAPIFRPPFAGLWLVALIYIGWTFFVYPQHPIWRGNLPDGDDYMYLTQLLDWLKGQNWYDNIQHRLDPPLGVAIHFSRLAQVPMAIITLGFEGLGFPPHGAALLMALVWPFVLLAFCFLVLRWAAETLMPKEWAGVTAYVALFATGTLFMFAPGHIDHHGLIVLLTTLTLGCALRAMGEKAARWSLYAGGLSALALTIALEVLPWLLVLSAMLGLYGAVHGGRAARHGLLYGLALYLGSIVGLLLTRPPATVFVPDTLTYSVTYVCLTGGIAVAFAGVALMASAQRWLRLGFGGALALLTGFWFLHGFPELSRGPYGAMDPELAQIMLGGIEEAKPLIGPEGWVAFLAAAGSVLIALPAGLWFLRRAEGQMRWRWALVTALLGAGFLLSAFYQRRFVGMTQAIAVLPLAAMLWRGWQAAGEIKGRIKVYAEIGLLLLVGPLPLVFMPAVLEDRGIDKGVFMFPALTPGNPCDMFALENVLKDPAIYGDRPRVILNTMDIGPELLFRTPHNVLSAPFHMDVGGNLDATRFFAATDPFDAERIARGRQADLVIACAAYPDLYLRAVDRAPPGPPNAAVATHFIQLLAAGAAPAWLKRVRFRGLDNYIVYEVLPPPDVPLLAPKRRRLR